MEMHRFGASFLLGDAAEGQAAWLIVVILGVNVRGVEVQDP